MERLYFYVRNAIECFILKVVLLLWNMCSSIALNELYVHTYQHLSVRIALSAYVYVDSAWSDGSSQVMVASYCIPLSTPSLDADARTVLFIISLCTL